MCIAVGKVSFDDWPRLTSSLGWIGVLEPISPPAISIARLEITSLAFMFDCVPLPVCKTTSGKWSSSLPAITSSAAGTISCTFSAGSWPSSPLASAAAFLRIPRAADHRPAPAKALDADLEVVPRPLGLGAPIAVGGNLHAPHAVGFGAEGRAGHAWLLKTRCRFPLDSRLLPARVNRGRAWRGYTWPLP